MASSTAPHLVIRHPTCARYLIACRIHGQGRTAEARHSWTSTFVAPPLSLPGHLVPRRPPPNTMGGPCLRYPSMDVESSSHVHGRTSPRRVCRSVAQYQPPRHLASRPSWHMCRSSHVYVSSPERVPGGYDPPAPFSTPRLHGVRSHVPGTIGMLILP